MPSITNTDEVVGASHSLLAAQKGNHYLLKNSRTFVSESETGLTWKDNFLDAMLLEITGNWNLVDMRIPAGKWNYFGGKPCSLTTDPYPEDIDTQSLVATVIKPVESVAHALMDEMLATKKVDGIIPVSATDIYCQSGLFTSWLLKSDKNCSLSP